MTSEIEIGLNEDFRVIPGMGEFGDRYFGTDDDDEQVVVASQKWNQTQQNLLVNHNYKKLSMLQFVAQFLLC